MYLIYNNIYFFDNNKSKCHLQIYSPIRNVDILEYHISEYNYWLIIANENYLDEGLSLPGDVKQFLYNLFYKFDIPYNKAVYIETHNKEEYVFNAENNIYNVVILDNRFPVTNLKYRPIDRKEIEYLKGGRPIKSDVNPTFISDGWNELVEYWKQYIYCNV